MEIFAWCHTVYNPGGWIVDYDAIRLERSIVSNKNPHHAPEILLAIDAQKDFIDFLNHEMVGSYINSTFNGSLVLTEKADLMVNHMHDYMIEKYLEAINYE